MSCTRLETQLVKLGMVSPKVGVDFSAVSEIIGDRAVNLLKRQGVIVIGDTFRRKAAQKITDNCIKRDTTACDPISAINLLDVACFQCVISSFAHSNAGPDRYQREL